MAMSVHLSLCSDTQISSIFLVFLLIFGYHQTGLLELSQKHKHLPVISVFAQMYSVHTEKQKEKQTDWMVRAKTKVGMGEVKSSAD